MVEQTDTGWLTVLEEQGLYTTYPWELWNWQWDRRVLKKDWEKIDCLRSTDEEDKEETLSKDFGIHDEVVQKFNLDGKDMGRQSRGQRF
jgi:hypothetical protein